MYRQFSVLFTFSLTAACASTGPGSSSESNHVEESQSGPSGPGSSSESDTAESEAATGFDETHGETDDGESGGPAPLECEGYNEADFPEQPVTFTVDGERAIMAGYVTSTTPAEVSTLLHDHPEVETIIMPFVPGSEDDESNLQAARMIHAAGLNTCVPSTGLIASGGVDFFLAGAHRGVGSGAQVGVHSWADGNGVEGGDLPMDHPDHGLFLDFYGDIDVDAAFYWFTLQAAPSADVHWMSEAELDTYGVRRD